MIGLGLGIPAAHLCRYLRSGEPLEAEALGIVLVCGGLALRLGISFLLSAMVLGAVIINFARENEEPFRLVENVEWPFLVLFFVLSGASLEIDQLAGVGWIGVGYIVLRAVGSVAGAWCGGVLAKTSRFLQRWMGLAMLPQAGVALGMALVAGEHFPEVKNVILPIIISSTVVFELVGPLFTRAALQRSGNA